MILIEKLEIGSDDIQFFYMSLVALICLILPTLSAITVSFLDGVPGSDDIQFFVELIAKISLLGFVLPFNHGNG